MAAKCNPKIELASRQFRGKQIVSEGLNLKTRMSHEAATWLNRIGIILGFFSFWFAAPEFIGQERLKMWERSMATLVNKGLPEAADILYLLLALLIFNTIVAWALLKLIHKTFLVGIPVDLITSVLFGLILTYYRRRVKAAIEGITQNIVSILANDQKQRQRALFFGALLFTVSTVLEFLATFESAK